MTIRDAQFWLEYSSFDDLQIIDVHSRHGDIGVAEIAVGSTKASAKRKAKIALEQLLEALEVLEDGTGNAEDQN